MGRLLTLGDILTSFDTSPQTSGEVLFAMDRYFCRIIVGWAEIFKEKKNGRGVEA
jgi:hypothetical protein